MSAAVLERLRVADLVARVGRVRRILPTYLEADGPAVAVGRLCAIESRPGDRATLAEVVGVHTDSVILAPLAAGDPILPGARVLALADGDQAPVGDALLGRAVDPLGRPVDDGPPLRGALGGVLGGPATPALRRAAADRPLATGVAAIDSLLTLAEGQRVGIFAASGVGKTTLLTQLARQVEADCCVICLVGERGREAKALWSSGLSSEARARSVLVTATSDQSAAMRGRAGDYAVAVAEHFRDHGRHVLLLVDSVTRLAMALRETGLAAGEPPLVRGYTPGVFAALPRLVERCGAVAGSGAITAIFTVLSETDDVDDPVCEMMKSILDGHIVLSRSLAERGHFPAIDVPRSVSRLAHGLQAPDARSAARDAVAALSAYEASRTLIESGLYAQGASVDIDRAIARRPGLLAFLRQEPDAAVAPPEAARRLVALMREEG